jgi:hypothetical protein
MAKKIADFLFEDLTKKESPNITLTVVMNDGKIGFDLFQGKVQVGAASLKTAEDVARQLLAFAAEAKAKEK